MQLSDYVALIALVVSLAGFAWNVWSKFIHVRPSAKVGFRVVTIVGGVAVPNERFVVIEVTNHGPGELPLVSARGRNDQGHFHVMEQPTPYGPALPTTIQPGNTHTIYFPFDSQSIGRSKLKWIGVVDGYGRKWKAPRRDLKTVKTYLDETFWEHPFIEVRQ